MSGFAYARKDSAPGDDDFLARFSQWVHDRYQITSVQNWEKIIVFFSMTEVDEMTLFGELLDEYPGQGKGGRMKVP